MSKKQKRRNIRLILIALVALIGVLGPLACAAMAQETIRMNKEAAQEFCKGLVVTDSTVRVRCIRMLLDGTTVEDINGIADAAAEMKMNGVGMPKADYTVDLSRSGQSNFKLFGQEATTTSVGTLSLSAEHDDWSIWVAGVDGLGGEQHGDIAKYWDGTLTRKREMGNFTLGAGVEIFYVPVQLGEPSATFISPLATVEWEPNDRFSLLVGGQYVGTYRTVYAGDRSYGWIEPTFSVGKRLKLSLSPGVVFADTGRSTQYVHGSVEWSAVPDRLTFYTSYLEAKTWDGQGVVRIRPTWTYGIKVDF